MFRHFPSSFAWFAAFFAALGTLFFVIGTHTFYRNWQFSGAVLRASGVVTAKDIHVSHGRHGSSTSYTVSYRYFDLDGTGYVSNSSVVSSTYYQVAVNESLPIKYLPKERGINRIDFPDEDAHYTATAWGFTLLGGAFGGFGWWSFISLERLIFYRRWLRKNGVRCAGKVVHVESANLQVNKRPVHYLVYTYTDGSGQRHEGSTEGLTATEDNMWLEGDPAVVFCDPRDSTRSAMLLRKS
jgi:hypothetical protein